MKYLLISMITFCTLLSCGSDADMPGTIPEAGNNNSQITQTDFEDLIAPCTDQSNTITLPDAMNLMSNYIQFEATTEIFSVQQFSKSLLGSLNLAFLPPVSALYADIDGLSVFEGDKAYDWKIGPDTYRYILKDNGYELRFYKDSNLISLGRKLVFVEQSADCTDFEYIQYAIEEDGDQMVGDIVFRYNYQRSGKATLINFGTDISSPDSEEYDMRGFDDLSGDMFVRANGAAVRKYIWQSNGNGSYDILEDLVIVESGTWTF